MMYLFDTDHFSILQRKAGAEYQRLSAWMGQYTATDFACCVVGLHEQVVGAHAFLNRGKTTAGLVRGYQLLARLPTDYLQFPFLPFDAPNALVYDQLLAQSLRVGVMDLRLSAIALSRGLTVLTRNLQDFGRVPGLKIEDRTV